jgi:hypothetical protein
VLCVEFALWIRSGSALCWICAVLDLLSEAGLDLLCVGSALCCIWSGAALCWVCSVLDLLYVGSGLDLFCVGSALCLIWSGICREWQVAGPHQRPPMHTTPKYEGKCISPNGGHSEGVFLLRGRQPLRFRRLVGLLRSRYRARNPVDGLCLGHAGPAPCFGVNGSRAGGTKNRSVSPSKSDEPLWPSHVYA